MHRTSLSQQLGALRAWQQSQLRLLDQLQPWLDQQGLRSTEVDQALDRARYGLADQRLTIAVAGEFSRGKTELLNALFFADLNCRLLPTDAGRTTMCPTEIFHDPARAPMLRLLPIETRSGEQSLNALRSSEAEWHEIPLPMEDTDALVAVLQRLTEQQTVPLATAAALGLPVGKVEGGETGIPRWRLAQLNIPHPLLDQGLRILDTPGLNAIGNEPELTYEMLPAAHAVIFVLAADTGVTASDLEIWQRYIQRPQQQRGRGLMVVLNKTDTLWDDLRPTQHVAESIFRQCATVAGTLAIDNEQVFAVSAQKALLARVRSDAALEARSGIRGLEKHIGDCVMHDRIRLIQAEHARIVTQAFDALEISIRSRLKHNGRQRRELLELAGRSAAAINQMLERVQRDHERYQTNLEVYRRGQDKFGRQTTRLLEALNGTSLEERLSEIHRTMTGAWTTIGLRDAMDGLFAEINSRIDVAGSQTQQMRRQLRRVHRHFEQEHAFTLPPPPMFSIVHYQVELSLLEQEAEQFRNSARTTLMEQHFVTRRYFNTIVSRARRVIRDAHDEAQRWTQSVMEPLTAEVEAYRESLARQIDDLHATAQSRRTIHEHVAALRHDGVHLQAQMTTLNRVRQMIGKPVPKPEPPITAEASGQN